MTRVPEGPDLAGSGDDPDVAGSDDRSGIAAAYDRWASTYDIDPNRTRELAGAVLRRSGIDLVDKDVVEIGSGTGRNTVWLAERARAVLALDISAEMLRVARSRMTSPTVRLLRHDICETWPIPDRSADVIVATLVLEHVRELDRVLGEAARVLRRDGQLFICELHPARQMLGRQAEFTDPETGERERVTAFLHDVSDYVDVCLRLGFALVHLGEWRDDGDDRGRPPRILSLRFRLPEPD